MKKAVLFIVAAAFALSACASFGENPRAEAKSLVVRAADTVDRFKSEPRYRSLARMLPTARAVVVLPRVIKAGLFGGAAGGNAVLVARGRGGGWGYPAFYTLGAASFGIQAGVESTEVIMVVRNDKALKALIKNQGKLGTDLDVTVGLLGMGVEGATTTNVGADIVAFSNGRLGIFGGLSLQGAMLARRNDYNEAYYAAGATPGDIVMTGRYRNGQADRLRDALAAITSAGRT